jgi:hypothetical protein
MSRMRVKGAKVLRRRVDLVRVERCSLGIHDAGVEWVSYMMPQGHRIPSHNDTGE